MDGIWYFSEQPLTDSQFLAMATAINQATAGDGNGEFLKWLKLGGVPADAVELRYVGQALDGEMDLTKRLNGDVFGATSGPAPPAPPPSSMSTSTIGIIVGSVVGGVLLVALGAILVASNRRRSSKVQKEALTQRWKTERDLVEAEKLKMDALNGSSSGGVTTGGGGGGGGSFMMRGGSSTASRINPAHTAGFVAMTNHDLDQQRSMRRATTMAAQAQLSTKAAGVTEASPSMAGDRGQSSSGAGAQKPSRLESMRSALGLNKSKSGVAAKKGSPGGGSPGGGGGGGGGWTVDGPGARQLSSTPSRTLRSQYSVGSPTPTATPPLPSSATRTPSSRFGASAEQDASTPSPWGKMFSK